LRAFAALVGKYSPIVMESQVGCAHVVGTHLAGYSQDKPLVQINNQFGLYLEDVLQSS
jgi:hypothetical protein